MSDNNPVSKEVLSFLKKNRIGKVPPHLEILDFFKRFRREEKKLKQEITEGQIWVRFGALFGRSSSWAYHYACLEKIPDTLVDKVIQEGKLTIPFLEASKLGRMDPRKPRLQEEFLEKALKKAGSKPGSFSGTAKPIPSSSKKEKQPLPEQKQEDVSEGYKLFARYHYTYEPERPASRRVGGYEVQVIKGSHY